MRAASPGCQRRVQLLELAIRETGRFATVEAEDDNIHAALLESNRIGPPTAGILARHIPICQNDRVPLRRVRGPEHTLGEREGAARVGEAVLQSCLVRRPHRGDRLIQNGFAAGVRRGEVDDQPRLKRRRPVQAFVTGERVTEIHQTDAHRRRRQPDEGSHRGQPQVIGVAGLASPVVATHRSRAVQYEQDIGRCFLGVGDDRCRHKQLRGNQSARKYPQDGMYLGGTLATVIRPVNRV